MRRAPGILAELLSPGWALDSEAVFLSCRAEDGGAVQSHLLSPARDGQCCEHVLQDSLHWDRQGPTVAWLGSELVFGGPTGGGIKQYTTRDVTIHDMACESPALEAIPASIEGGRGGDEDTSPPPPPVPFWHERP